MGLCYLHMPEFSHGLAHMEDRKEGQTFEEIIIAFLLYEKGQLPDYSFTAIHIKSQSYNQLKDINAQHAE